MSQDSTSNVINASPTKNFFISILVRDIKLADAIADLIDNCVDGARRLRPDGKFDGLSITVNFDKERFSIVDNCGGIPVDIAKNYAFRFGRPEGMPETKSSVGQFGVGMKRALFKMGNHFNVKSVVSDATFDIEVDVPTWRASKTEDGAEKWAFEFNGLEENQSNPESDCGTTVVVTNLHPSISDEFGSPIFESRLLDAVQAAHEQSMMQGLAIQINNHGIKNRLSTLLESDKLKPLVTTHDYKITTEKGEQVVTAKIYAGVSDAYLEHAGWYVICNGRQILRADKSKTTGWDDAISETKIPKAHYQFSRFRGFIFFECDDASVLPWNTMKNAVDPDSPVYQFAKIQMALAMRQIIDFLNKVDGEADTAETLLSQTISESQDKPLYRLEKSSTFVYPTAPVTGKPPKTTVRVSFVRPIEEVDFAKAHFDVDSPKLAGERAFEYFLERERT